MVARIQQSSMARRVRQRRRGSSLTTIPEHAACSELGSASISAESKRSAEVPDIGPYSNNHVMVNQERHHRGLECFTRSVQLDQLARFHAEMMAYRMQVFHSVKDIRELQAMLEREHVGENVQRGRSLIEMHKETMSNPHQRINQMNILSRNFTEFGMGTAVGPDGMLYCCQYFRS